MRSRDEIARITADIEELGKYRDGCTDSGIRKLVEARIAQQKTKLGIFPPRWLENTGPARKEQHTKFRSSTPPRRT